MADAPAGWYPDPANPNEEVYWLGDAWSPARRTIAQIPAAELTPPPPPARTEPTTSTPVEPSADVEAVPPAPAATASSTPPLPGAKPKNTLGLWAMVCGLVTVFFAIIPGLSFAAWIPAIGAIVLGILGLRVVGKPHGQSLAGLVLGPVGFLIAIVVSITFIGSLGNASKTARDSASEPTAVQSASATPSASPTPTSPPVATSPYGTYPAAEATFVQTIATAEKSYSAASTDLQRSQVIATRDSALCALIPGNHVDNWVGTIHDIGANGDGYAWVNVEIAPTVVVQTWNNAFSDISANTLIHQDAPFFQTLVPMKEGQKITFSGDFVTSDTCLTKENLTQTFYALDPNFIFRFSGVSAQ